MSASARIVSFLTIFALLFSFNTSLYADDNTTLPTVESLSGSTAGNVGSTYTFATSVVSDAGHEIVDVFLEQTTDADTSAASTIIDSVSTGAPNCTDFSCSLSANFTPTVAATYYIYVVVNYASTSCNTHPSINETNCFESRGRYMTFVVTEVEEENLPSTGISANRIRNIFFGLGFIVLGVLTTQSFRISETINTLNEKKSEKRRFRFEKKF